VPHQTCGCQNSFGPGTLAVVYNLNPAGQNKLRPIPYSAGGKFCGNPQGSPEDLIGTYLFNDLFLFNSIFVAFLSVHCLYMRVSVSWPDMALCFMPGGSHHRKDNVGCRSLIQGKFCGNPQGRSEDILGTYLCKAFILFFSSCQLVIFSSVTKVGEFFAKMGDCLLWPVT
jgi:hypothetical protein